MSGYTRVALAVKVSRTPIRGTETVASFRTTNATFVKSLPAAISEHVEMPLVRPRPDGDASVISGVLRLGAHWRWVVTVLVPKSGVLAPARWRVRTWPKSVGLAAKSLVTTVAGVVVTAPGALLRRVSAAFVFTVSAGDHQRVILDGVVGVSGHRVDVDPVCPEW